MSGGVNERTTMFRHAHYGRPVVASTNRSAYAKHVERKRSLRARINLAAVNNVIAFSSFPITRSRSNFVAMNSTIQSPSSLPHEQTPVAWIAGVGASAGLGAAVARRFSQGGFTVAVTGRTAERVESIAAEIRSAGGVAHALPGDISNEAIVAELAERVRELGPLTAAVFNAGGASRAPTLELSAADFEQAWRSGVLGGFLFAQAALRRILNNGLNAASSTGRGTLLFTGATAALRGRPPFAAFAASKAALRSLSQTLAREFGAEGVHVAHIVIDGGIDGERLRQSAPHRVHQAGDDGLLQASAIAESYWQLHQQHRSAWTQELDLRPFKETF
jgi:NAD(P)-dependent dehydrogenase (short-subunit alcohol dehydrogenase family)